jgi:hypothetical protein
MAIIVKTDKPIALLNAIKKAIDNGEIDTWSYDEDGDFTHTPPQWINEAWLRPKTYLGELRFGIIKQEGSVLTKLTYGIYHGRFTEMLLDHFDESFESAKVTALLTDPDEL